MASLFQMKFESFNSKENHKEPEGIFCCFGENEYKKETLKWNEANVKCEK